MWNLEPSDPAQVGRYRLLSRLGEGGMGRVYLARSERGRTVAVKLVQPDLARVPEFRERFRHEVSVSQRVAGEWTTPVLDADTEAEQPWVATGYVPGPSLQSVIAHEHGPLPTASLRFLAHGLTQALREVHGVGLVHRDLKPANVLVTIDGPRLIDFGIARAVETTTGSSLTRTGAVVGSPGFLSPEQVRGERVSPASDVFALGCVLAFAAGGRSPFGTAEGGQHALMFRVAEHAPDLTTVPEEWHPFIGACLEKEPERRPRIEQLIDGTSPAEGAGAAPWLPATLIASLGRHAAELLARESPAQAAPARESAQRSGSPTPAPQAQWSPSAPGQGTPTPQGTGGPQPAAAPGTPPPWTGNGTPPPPHGAHGTPPPQPAHGTPPPVAAGAIPPPPYRGPLTYSLLRQARKDREVIRLTSWFASVQRFAQLAQHAERLGYAYESFTASRSRPPALLLRRRADSGSAPPLTPVDLLKARVTVDGMGTYQRVSALVGCVVVWAMTSLVMFNVQPKSAPVSFLFFGLLAVIAYFLLRVHERGQKRKLAEAGYGLRLDATGRLRYQPAPRDGDGDADTGSGGNPASGAGSGADRTPPPSWAASDANGPGRYGS